MDFKIKGGVPKGYRATEYRRVKKGELYLVVGRERNYPMKWKANVDSSIEVVILVKEKNCE